MGNGMNKILPGLYIGNFKDARDAEQLSKNKVTHILSVHDSARPMLEGVKYLCIPAADSPSQNLCFIGKHSLQFNGRDISKKVLNSSMSAASRARAAWFTDSRSAPLLSEGPGERAPCLLSSVLLWCPFHSETRVQNRAFHKRLKYKNVHFTRDSSTKTYVSQEVQVQKCSFHKRLRYKNVGFTRDSGTEMFISQEAQVQKCSFY
ncbi:dual specificity protein phosphatase 22 isoform X6 [Bubalus bubalis]|uniref:dual specificity protein phosphatase 22 isoform X6 n=1 Tax=Bubalus bubalis TaxID=89462 RepID=UPI001D103B27|nr:dual specificity protein phosphatase 22 isoform X6 [Bubalus bubalis]